MIIISTIMFSPYIKALIVGSLALFLLAIPAWSKGLNWEDQIISLADGGAVLVTDAQKKELFALHPRKPLIPASILKIVTAAAALHELESSYRFTTEFRISHEKDLYVVGRGDPYLVSEELALIAHELKSNGLNEVRNIFLNNRYFQENLVLDGTRRSLNPYDAYNGALCVNFNTIFLRVGPDGDIHTAEPQTPLTPMAREIAVKSGLKGEMRINLAESPEKCLLYAGELIQAFLEMHSVQVRGRVGKAIEDPGAIPLFYLHRSSRDLPEVLQGMFKYSNNFIANQIFLAMGASRYGPPASVEKAQQVMGDFSRYLGLPRLRVEEGSGLSRRNRVTATQMIVVLDHFRPYRHLLPREGQVWFKTGTLGDVKSMAGYMVPKDSPPLCFVIMLNGTQLGYQTRERIFGLLQQNLCE